MLLGATIGQHAQENKLNTEQVHELEDKFDRLKRDDLYLDTLDQKEKKETEEEKKEENKEDPEKEALKKFYEARKNLKGYQTIENTS
jgi:Ran GTPase-activating protein (RanGAP) involved in mRNA processing and transport